MLTIDVHRLGLEPGGRVLDLGCGRGRHTHTMSLLVGVNVFALDHNIEDLRHTAENFPTPAEGQIRRWSVLAGDALELPFPDAAFDAVVCSEVLEHLPDFETALDEIARVTRPGGVFSLSVPRAWPERICWALDKEYGHAPGGHVRIFNAGALRDAVVTRGFGLTGRNGAHALHSPYWWLRCAYGRRADASRLVRAYKKLLEWDLMNRPFATRAAESILDPVLGKSIVMYFEREAA